MIKKNNKSKKLTSNEAQRAALNKRVDAAPSLKELTQAPLDKTPKKEKKVSAIDKVRRIQPQYFRLSSVALFLIITGLFIALQGMERVDTISNTIHYSYIITILLSFMMPLLGFFFVKRYKST